MARFCKYCGTQLEDGQVCGCPQAQAEAAAQQQPMQPPPQPPQQPPVQPQQPPYQQPGQPQQQYQQQPYQQPYQQQPYQPPVPRAPSPVGIAFKNLGPFLKAYIQSPVNAARTAIQQGDLILSIILLAIQAIVVGLMMFSVLSKICGMILSVAMGGIGGMISGGGLFGGGPSIAPNFFLTLIFGILSAAICIIILVLLVFAIAKIMKSACTFKDALIACGAHSILVTALYVVAFVFFFLHLFLGMLFFVAALVAWVVLSVPTVQAITPNTEKGVFWLCLVAAALIALLVGGWISSKFLGMSVNAIRISYGGESATVGQMISQVGGLGGMMEDLIDEIF